MKFQHGFSLIEMAFVLVIVTLLLGGLLVPFATQVEQRRIAETQKAMEEIKEALLGFAIANKRLPCPDSTMAASGINANDGVEDPCSAAMESEGNLPWATLGVSVADAWGNHFHYRVSNAFTGPGGFTLITTGTLNVCSAAGCGVGTTSIAQNVPAVILSYGKNGYGSINANLAAGNPSINPCPAIGCSLDESENQNANNNFVSRTITPAGTPAGEFDDLVTWLSPNVLFNRMVAAGQLP